MGFFGTKYWLFCELLVGDPDILADKAIVHVFKEKDKAKKKQKLFKKLVKVRKKIIKKINKGKNASKEKDKFRELKAEYDMIVGIKIKEAYYAIGKSKIKPGQVKNTRSSSWVE